MNDIKRFVAIMLVMLSCNVLAGSGVDITDPQQVKLLVNIHEKLSKVSTAVTACMEKGGEHMNCMCKSHALIKQFNDSVNQAMAAHKAFNNMDMVHFKVPNGHGVSLNLIGLRKQANAKLACN